MCAGIECGNGTCIGGTCSCDPGYMNIGNNCERTCALNPCQELDIFSWSIEGMVSHFTEALISFSAEIVRITPIFIQ